MKLHLLLTNDIARTKPQTCKIVKDFGQLIVRFTDGTTSAGLHCIVEDEQINIINWLRPFNSFIKGSGVPQLENFSIVHIPDKL